MYTMCFCTNLKENPQFIAGQKHLDNRMSEDEKSQPLKSNTAALFYDCCPIDMIYECCAVPLLRLNLLPPLPLPQSVGSL